MSQLATQPNHLVCLQWTSPDTQMCFLNNPWCTAATTALQTYRAAESSITGSDLTPPQAMLPWQQKSNERSFSPPTQAEKPWLPTISSFFAYRKLVISLHREMVSVTLTSLCILQHWGQLKWHMKEMMDHSTSKGHQNSLGVKQHRQEIRHWEVTPLQPRVFFIWMLIKALQTLW